jgi:hypothetical protein
MNLRILIHEDATLDLHKHCNYLAQNNQHSGLQFFAAFDPILLSTKKVS